MNTTTDPVAFIRDSARAWREAGDVTIADDLDRVAEQVRRTLAPTTPPNPGQPATERGNR